MSIENPFNNPSQETPEPSEEQKEQEKRYEQWEKDHPETIIAPGDLRECGPEIAKFKEMLDSFELMHSLAELHEIIDLKPENAPDHPSREPARVALIPIVEELNRLINETNITPEKYEELKERYMRLSRAVGIIHGNEVDHTR